MAEITPTQQKNKKGLVKRMVKKSTRVDLTPMVDLGFLLVTFFVFTTTLAEPKMLKFQMPNDKDGAKDMIAESTAITLILAKDNGIYYHEGADVQAQYFRTDYTTAGIRKIIQQKRQAVVKQFGADRMLLIVKPSDFSTMKNLVNIIDECNINNVKRYYTAELNGDDKKIIGQD